MRILLAAMATLLLVLSDLVAQADIVQPKRGPPIVARVWEEGEEIIFNVYRTGVRQVTHGTERLDAKMVKKVDSDPDRYRAFWRRAEELAAGKAESWLALGLEARTQKLKDLAEYGFFEALARDPTQAGALKALGSKAVRLLAASPRTNPVLKEKLQAYLASTPSSEREGLAKEIEAAGCPWPTHLLERAWRSSQQPRNRIEDQRLTLDADQHQGGVYTLFVPKDYDPFSPTPLVVGLHGGGPGGKDRDAVVGSGKGAMNFFEETAAQLGWIVVCPTALRAPWSDPANDSFLLAILEEVMLLYNVDRNRVYLAGHSMGGFGAWYFGAKYAHLWAAISPNAGAGRPNLKRFEETLTGVYCYHGADDPVVPVGSDRATAEQMRDRGMDFVYCEIPNSGHGWPDEARREMWEFFKVRRLGVAPGRAERGRFAVATESLSSFLEKPTKREIAAFGPLGGEEPGERGPGELKGLLADLRAGGGRAEKASERLQAMRDPGAAAAVARVLADVRAGAEIRRFAALVLGGMGQTGALKALRRAALDESLEVAAEACLALGRLKDPEGPKVFLRALQQLARTFEKKKIGDRMHFSDFEALLEAAATMVDGIAASSEVEAALAVNFATAEVLLDPVEVIVSERAGQNVLVPRRRLARALLAAAEALSTPTLQPTLEALSSRAEFGVSEPAKALLRGPPEPPPDSLEGRPPLSRE